MSNFILTFLSLFISIQLFSQKKKLPTLFIDTVAIKSTKIATQPLHNPFSLASYQATTIQETRQQLSLQEYLHQIPGLFSLNASNYAQDLRIAIRGFGARSAFGIRGIKIIIDGIPETTPDGQGQIDNLNIGSINRLEVLKGPSAALYGNAAGGVIQITTKADFEDNFLKAGLTLGSFNSQQYQLSGGLSNKQTKVIVQAAHTRSDGYRNHSNLVNSNLNTRLLHQFSDNSTLNFQFNYTNSPTGNDPGGILQSDVDENRQQARENNVLFDAGEAIEQIKFGGQYTHQFNSQMNLKLYGFYNNRNFEGRIPIFTNGWINLQRNYYGQGGHFKLKTPFPKGKNTFQIGYEWANQQDDRTRFANEEGEKGNLALDQIERFQNIGLYALNHLQYKRWLIAVGLRYDYNKLAADDQKLDDGDQSGERNLPTFNPSIGINYKIHQNIHLYTNFRSSFETPVLSELSANPTGEAGFNEILQPQTATNYELGIKGIAGNNLQFDMTYFHIDTKNDLVSYELADFPERDFFRNAGSTIRDGLELNLQYMLNSKLSLMGSYTYSKFRYKQYQVDNNDFSGKLLPGIPPHRLAFQISRQSQTGLNIQLQHRYTATFYADDANTAAEPTYHLTDLSLSYRIHQNIATWIPFFGINNVFNTLYSDNIRLNAFGGRYYEPAAGINFYGGIRLLLK